MKTRSKLAAGVLGLLLAAELAVRASGLVDFPLYDANNRIGYIPKPSQRGSFLWDNTWAFNALSMGTDAEFVSAQASRDWLLIGDSIVLGGNNYAQEDKFGPQLAQRLGVGVGVWPAAAGSWALRNELTYIRLHPEVARSVRRVVFVLNSADFDEASSWGCEQTHPRSYPPSALVYAVRKYKWDPMPCDNQSPQPLRVPTGQWAPEFKALLSEGVLDANRLAFVLYPTQSETLDSKLRAEAFRARVPQLLAVVGREVPVLHVGDDSRWNAQLYRDGIHPSAAGYRVLAQLLAEAAVNWR